MTLKNFTLTIAALAALFTPVTAQAQVTLTSTTTSAAIGAGPAGTPVSFTVASASGITAPVFSVPNQPTGNQTVLYIDKEEIFVTGLSGTYVTGIRGYDSTNASAHVSGATVYVASPYQIGHNDKAGACTAATEPFLPYINAQNGNIFSCGTSGQWARVLSGTQTGAPSSTISFGCTGTVGSAETIYVGSVLVCSGSTTQLLRWTATTNGTVANLRASSTAAFLGTGSSIFTVFKNGSAVTGFTCAPTAAALACANMLTGFADAGTPGAVDSVKVVAGDTIDVAFLSATSDTAANLSVQLSVY